MQVGISGTFWGQDATGSGQYLRSLLSALVGLGSDEGSYTLFLPQYLAISDTGMGKPWCVHPTPTPLDRVHGDGAKVWFEQFAFPAACRRSGMHVAHVPYFAAPLRSAVPVIVTIHDLIPLLLAEYRGSLAVRGYMHLVAQAARKAALVVTDSWASARDIERILGISPARVRVIYLAAEARYRPLTPEERAPVLQCLGLPGRYVLYLGGFDRRKNVGAVMAAYGRAGTRLAGTRLVIAGRLPRGDSAFAPDPRRMADDLGLRESVHYTGWVAEEDKPALYAGATAFLFPSSYEGFGLPVLEAISCGTPAVVASGSSLEEVAGPAGLVVPPNDTEALAEAMVTLVRQDALREELSQQGLRHAQRFSWTETARQTLEAYREAAALGR